MRGAALLRLPLALLLAAMLLAAAAAPPAASARFFTTGITNLNTNAPLAFDRTRAAGASFVRIQLYWSGTAPEAQPASWQPEDPNDPHYHWDSSDDAVIQAVRAGLVPVFQVDGTPRWAQRCASPSAVVGGPALCDPDPAALRAFGIAAARRYSGLVPGIPRVQYWQPLNEPNLSLFFFPQFNTAGDALSPELYRALLNAFYSGVKAVDPSNLVISAGLGPTAVPPWTIGPMRFARQMLCMRGHRHPKPTAGNCGGGVHLDIFAIHPYTTGGPTHEGRINDVQFGDLPKLQELLKAADRAGRIKGAFPHTPLWITEFSWDSNPPDPGGLPMKIETQWTAEAVYRAWQAGVSNFFWYSLRDGPHQANEDFGESLESGLYFRGPTLEQDQPKPVLQTFRFPFVAIPRAKGLSFWGRLPNGAPGNAEIQFWKGSRWRPVGSAGADLQGIFSGLLKTGYGRNGRGLVRARFANETSTPFPIKRVGDFRHPPFG